MHGATRPGEEVRRNQSGCVEVLPAHSLLFFRSAVQSR